MDDASVFGTSSRRQALKTGAAVVGAALWVTPMVEAMTVTQASAAQPSGKKETDKVKVEKVEKVKVEKVEETKEP